MLREINYEICEDLSKLFDIYNDLQATITHWKFYIIIRAVLSYIHKYIDIYNLKSWTQLTVLKLHNLKTTKIVNDVSSCQDSCLAHVKKKGLWVKVQVIVNDLSFQQRKLQCIIMMIFPPHV